MMPNIRRLRQQAKGSTLPSALASALVVLGVWTSNAVAATDGPGEEIVLICQIEGRDRQASVSLTETGATYRYGPSQAQPERRRRTCSRNRR